jgi:aminoglycoside phosphotransferase (APT) family kinase protein
MTAPPPLPPTAEGVASPEPDFAPSLRRWLDSRLAGDWAAARLHAFTRGQSNPTFLVEAGPARYVLRKKPPGALQPSAHAIDREFRVLEALSGRGVPVPRPLLYCDDATVIGTPFYLMDHVEGRVFADPRLPGLTPAERHGAYASFIDCLARLHRLAPAGVGLADFGRAGQYYERQISRWSRQYRAAETERIPPMERLLDWLPAHRPSAETTCVVHGDYRFENVIFHPTEPRVVAILDWELATLGDPLSDVAYAALWYRLPPHAFHGLAGADLAGSGIPDEDTLLAGYCEAAGRPEAPAWNFYIAFAFFRLAAILQGVRRRALDGNAAAPDALERGSLASLCAELGWQAASAAPP